MRHPLHIQGVRKKFAYSKVRKIFSTLDGMDNIMIIEPKKLCYYVDNEVHSYSALYHLNWNTEKTIHSMQTKASGNIFRTPCTWVLPVTLVTLVTLQFTYINNVLRQLFNISCSN